MCGGKDVIFQEEKSRYARSHYEYKELVVQWFEGKGAIAHPGKILSEISDSICRNFQAPNGRYS